MQLSKIEKAYILNALLFVLNNFNIYFYIQQRRMVVSFVLSQKKQEQAMKEIHKLQLYDIQKLFKKFGNELKKIG